MGMFDIFTRSKGPELRSNEVAISDPRIAEVFGGLFGSQSAAGVTVNTDTALGVPSVWSAVNFLSGTMAGLPLNVYRRSKEGRKKLRTGVAPILHDAVNDEMSSFEWRKTLYESVFTGGRGFTYIERNASGRVVNLFPLDPACVEVKRSGFKKVYLYKEGNNNPITYESSEIIDIPFMLRSDGVKHRSPIYSNKNDIGLAIAATNYGSRFFQNGGVPPFSVTGNFQKSSAIERASNEITEAIKRAASEGKQVLAFPAGLEVKSLGVDPEKSQLVDLQRFCVEQIARIYSMPPTFLQDLTNGTFSNTEQQDLHFVKHTIRRWVEQFEQELNLKLFGRNPGNLFAELNLDGLLRGDFKTRMEGYASGVQNGILQPNEVRRKENLPDDPDGGKLMIQGATVPISNQLNLPLEGENNGS